MVCSKVKSTFNFYVSDFGYKTLGEDIVAGLIKGD
jgi:hypothetical protein